MFTNITAVIVNWNSKKLLENQVQTLAALVSKIIIVDNNSEESLSGIEKQYTNVSLIQNDYNRGFAAACNQGLAQVKTAWTLFLNPDVNITKENINALLEQGQAHNLQAVSVQTDAHNYSKPLPSVLSLLTEFSPLRKIISQNWFRQKTLVGGILLTDTTTLNSLGGFDERFFLWFEDSDLTKQFLDSGHTIGFCKTSVAHLGGFSLKKLTKTLQKDLFFTAMSMYSKKYFAKFGQVIIAGITKRFSTARLLPAVNKNLTSLVVPNMKLELLDTFLKNNLQYFSKSTELIIVTSALSGKTIWQYRETYPLVRFIPIAKNYGFAHTVNIGLRVATGSFVGTCNDDVILQKNWIEKLREHTTATTGSVNPVILDSTGSIESAGITVLPKGKAYPVTKLPKQVVTTTDATNAACVLYNKQALNKVGLFDERFGSYLEDIDLSLRLQRAGYENIVVRSVQVTHQQHQTAATINFNKAYHDYKNWLWVILKNWSLLQLLAHLPAIILERARNISGMVKANKTGTLFLLAVVGFAVLFAFTRLYKIETSLLFFNDIGRDFLVLFRWNESGKPPLLGPQTSALPYNQSAFYFYMLYPAYLLSNASPFATIYTAVAFYIGIWFFGVWYLRKNAVLLASFIASFVLILIHPQFIIQNRFVWNPTFLGPLILLAFYSFEKLRQTWNTRDLLICAASISLAVSLNYSAAPLFIALMLYGLFVFFKKQRFVYFYLVHALALAFWNLPTIAFEIRYKFLLTNLLFTGEKLSQVATSVTQKTADLLLYVFYGIPASTAYLFLGLVVVFLLVSVQQNLKLQSTVRSAHLFSALVLLVLTVLITYVAPISVQAHYIFAVLTMLFILVSLLDYRLYLLCLVLLGYYWLQPAVISSYLRPAYRSVEQTQACAQVVCADQSEPLFISVQSDLHPYHNGMEFKYLFSQAGCSIKELDTQIEQAEHMAVIVDSSKYTHKLTTYNELTQFGDSEVVTTYSCSEKLEVVLLRRQ